jgi:hypothetical protein
MLMNLLMAAGFVLLFLSLYSGIGGAPGLIAAMVLIVASIVCLLWAYPRTK